MGVYEPLITLGSSDQAGVRTSRLHRRDDADPGMLVHEECFARRAPASGESSA